MPAENTAPRETPLDRTATETSLLALGERIRQTRQQKGMTLKDLSAATGLSVSMLSLVERGRTSPSLGSLIVIASALQIPLSDLVAGIDQHQNEYVVRREDQTVVSPWPGVSRQTAKIDRLRHIEISMNEWASDSDVEPQPARHPGYEYAFIIEGELTVELEDQVHVVRAGDLISYPSTMLHRPWNSGGGRVRAVWVNVGSF